MSIRVWNTIKEVERCIPRFGNHAVAALLGRQVVSKHHQRIRTLWGFGTINRRANASIVKIEVCAAELPTLGVNPA